MPMSWAAVAAAPPPPPTPIQRIQALRDFCSTQSNRSLLLNALGFISLSGASPQITSLAEHTVVIGIDTEAWTKDTDQMTEIGLVVFERKDMVDVQRRKKQWEQEHGADHEGYDHLGDFGEELLKKISFYHLRIVETAHLRTNAEWMKGPEGNRFGRTRFVTFAEARDILDSLFAQPISSRDPVLRGCMKPVILVGHAMYHDEENLKKNGLRYDWYKHGTIVTTVDTQPLAKATNTWFNPDAPSNLVGLDTLTKRLGFEHTDAHTACNDAARTVVSAIQMVLPKACRNEKEKDMQTLALEIEQHSRRTFASRWGTELCCTRCGGRDHEDKAGAPCTVAVCCKACVQFDEADDKHWATHIDQFCLHVANYKAWIRRRDDAKRKRNKIPPGPPEDSHPPFDPTLPLRDRHSASAKTPECEPPRSPGSSGSTTSSHSPISLDRRVETSTARIVTYQSAGRARRQVRGDRGVVRDGGEKNENGA